MKSQRSNTSCAFVLTGLMLLSALSSVADAGQTCKDSAGNSPCLGTNSPCVCVERDDLTPVENTHFTFDFSDSSNPDVTLRTGNLTWKVFSQNHATDTTPAALGDIKTDPSIDADNFAITIVNGTGAGASNVKSIVLNEGLNPNWSGYSSLATGSRISGDLAGNLWLFADANGNGGDLDLTVDGDVSGLVIAWEIPQGATFKVGGVLSQAVLLGDLFGCGGDVGGTIDINKWDDDGVAPVIDIAGDITATGVVRVREFVPSGTNVLELRPFGDVAGDIILDNGIPADAAVIGHLGVFPSVRRST